MIDIDETPLCTKPRCNVSCSISFKEQMKQDIIQFVERMIEKEKEHLYWLERTYQQYCLLVVSTRNFYHSIIF